jgi:hypothetical protein
MFALIFLMVWGWSRSSHKSFLIFAGVALALTAARRLNNAIVAWTDLMDVPTYSWLANVMWIPRSPPGRWPGIVGARVRGAALMCWPQGSQWPSFSARSPHQLL